jgi:hypothetical protein
LVKLTPDQWKMVITAVAWGFKHPMRNVADTCECRAYEAAETLFFVCVLLHSQGPLAACIARVHQSHRCPSFPLLLPLALRIMKEILDRVQRIPEMTQDFYVNFYLEILQEILSVMTDSAHLAGTSQTRSTCASLYLICLVAAGFYWSFFSLLVAVLCANSQPVTFCSFSGINLQSVILAHLFYVVESGQVSRPLGDNPNNTEFVRDYVANLLQSAFPHLQEYVGAHGGQRGRKIPPPCVHTGFSSRRR